MLELFGTLLTKLAESGIVGVFCAIFLVIAGVLGRMLLKSKGEFVTLQERRLDDQKAFTKALVSGNASVNELLLEMKDFTSEMTLKTALSQQEQTTKLTSQEKEFIDLKKELVALVEKNEKSYTRFGKVKGSLDLLTQQQAALTQAINQRGA